LALEIVQMVIVAATGIFALLTATFKNLLYAAISFGAMCISLGALYWTLYAPYVGLFQMLIYGGAVVVLFVSVITLTRGEEV